MTVRQRKAYTDRVAFPDRLELAPIGRVCSPYVERYGTPRQASALDPSESGPQDATIELLPHIPTPALADLAGFERIWVLAWFHLNSGWKPTVVPPRTPGQGRGLFATRSPHRPNPLSLSAVRLVRVQGRVLHVRGIDLLDGTPVLDIKPYVPYADAFPDSAAGWIDALPEHWDERTARGGAPRTPGGGGGALGADPCAADEAP